MVCSLGPTSQDVHYLPVTAWGQPFSKRSKLQAPLVCGSSVFHHLGSCEEFWSHCFTAHLQCRVSPMFVFGLDWGYMVWRTVSWRQSAFLITSYPHITGHFNYHHHLAQRAATRPFNSEVSCSHTLLLGSKSSSPAKS